MEVLGPMIIATLLVVFLYALYLSARGRSFVKYRWETDWEGHRIVVKRCCDALLQEKEELLIDGTLVFSADPSASQIREDLYGEIQAGGKVRRVHAHIGYADEDLEVGCVISVDGFPVGGDVSKRFYT